MNRQCFVAARLTWPAYVDSRKLENSYVWKYGIIVASTCRRSVQFGRARSRVVVRGGSRSCVVVLSRAWSFAVVRGRAWSFVVARDRSWSRVIVRDRSWSCVVGRDRAPDPVRRKITWQVLFSARPCAKSMIRCESYSAIRRFGD